MFNFIYLGHGFYNNVKNVPLSDLNSLLCQVRVRRVFHWATAARHIAFMLCSVFILSRLRIIDSVL